MNIVFFCYVMLFIIFLLLKECFNLIKLYKQERECYVKTLNHDLRVATLAQIRALDLLYKTCSAEQKDLVKDINESCKYSLDMISCLLNTYKFNNGEEVLRYSVFSLTDLLNKSVACVKDLYCLRNFKFQIEFAQENYVEADRDLLYKLLNILLITSVINSTTQELKILVKNNKKNYTISIMYQGNPISEEEYRRMFLNKPAYTTVGNGIRMYFCKKIIDFHGGSIRVLRDKNSNMFTFTLPIRKVLKTPSDVAFNLKKKPFICN